MKLGTARTSPGKWCKGSLKVARHKGKNLKLPVRIAQGKKEGPVCFILGGMHGDELNGIALAHRARHALNIKQLSGTVLFLPTLNPWGFEQGTRTVPFDNVDLNRSFAGEGRTTTFQIARTLKTQVLSKVDFGIDCHDGNPDNILLAHVRSHVSPSGKCVDGCTIDVGKFFGSEVIVQRMGAPGMLARTANEEFGIPVLTVELGGGYRLFPKFLEEGVTGIQNILRLRGLLPGALRLPRHQVLLPLKNRSHLLAPCTGLLTLHARLGTEVHAGQELATLYDPDSGKHRSLKSRACGVVFSVRASGRVGQGQSVVSVLSTFTCPSHGQKRKSMLPLFTNRARKGVKVYKNRYL